MKPGGLIGLVVVCACLGVLSGHCRGDSGGGSPEPSYFLFKPVQLQDATPGRQQIGHFNISGTGIAGFFKGNGSMLTSVNADMLDGLDSTRFGLLLQDQSWTGANIFTNAGNSFAGSGAGLTSLNAANVTSGKLADARLSSNVALLNGTQAFAGANTFTNASNSFTGSGAGLTSLNAANVASGTLADARLSANVALLNNAQTFSGVKTFAVAPGFTAAGSPFTVSSTTKVTNLNADLLDGKDSSAFLTGVPNPLSLVGSQAGGSIIRATNSATADGSCGVSGESTAASGYTYGVSGLTSSYGAGVYGRTSSYVATSAGVLGRGAGASGAIPMYSSGVWGDSSSGFGVIGTSQGLAAVVGSALATSGENFGVWGYSASSEGRGVYGAAGSSSGECYGVYGETYSGYGIGVFGEAITDYGAPVGVYGRCAGSHGTGVVGEATSATGSNVGVHGKSAGTAGKGVLGWASASSSLTYGGWFQSDSPTGIGAFGYAVNTSGTNYGVYGQSRSSSGYGVYGTVESGTANAGVYGVSTASNGTGTVGEANTGGSAYGVWGKSATGYGVVCSGHAYVVGDLTVTGSKSGYVSDLVMNVDDEPLEPGDLVEIAGYADPLIGEIPVICVRKTRGEPSRAVLGPIAHAVEVAENPRYEEESASLDAAALDAQPWLAPAMHHVRHIAGAIMPDGYGQVVTLGAFKTIKVDASYGPIQPGDLLVSSPSPGYAMRDDDPRVGTVIGKALGGLDWGTGTVPVLVQAR